MKRILLRVVLGLVLAVAAVAGFAAWLVGTEAGTRFAWRHAGAFVPYEIEVESLDGRLVGPLVVNGLVLRGERMQIELERARLDWHPAALLERTLSIERLELEGLDVLMRAAEDAPAEAEEAWQPPARIDPPLVVTVGRASLVDLRYHTPDGDPVVVDRVQLSGHWNDDELLADELEARGPLFAIAGRARIRSGEPFRTEARFEWSFEPPGYAEAVGTTEILGDLGRLSVEQRVESPYNVRAELQVTEPLAALVLNGRLEVDVEFSELGGGLPAAMMTADIAFAGPPDRLEIAADARLGSADIDPIELSLQAALAGRTLEVEALGLEQPASGAALDAAGRATLGQDPRFDVEGAWTGLRWPLTGDAIVASDMGALRVAGGIDDYDVELEGEVAAPRTAGQFRVRGAGSAEALSLSEIEVEALGGRLSGTAELRADPSIGADLELTASDIDPRDLVDAWPGRIDGRLDASGELDEQGALSVQVDELGLEGRLRERDIELAARGAYADETLRLEMLTLEAGTTQVEASGSIGESADIELSVDSRDLGDLWPGAGGRLMLDGRSSGPPERPYVVLDASGQALDLLDARIDALTLSAEIDFAGEQDSRMDLSIEEAVLAGTQVHTLGLSGAGNAAGHELEMHASTDLGEAQIGLTGRVERVWQPDFDWQFELATAALDPVTLAAWQLRAPSRGRVGAGRAGLDRTCWQSGDAALCLEADHTPDRTAGSWSLSDLPIEYLSGLLASPMELEGAVSAEGELVAAADEAPRFNMSLQSTRGRAVSSESGAELDFGPLDGQATASADGVDASLSLPLAEQGQIDLTARVGAGTRDALERPLEGRIVVRMDELGIVSELSAQVEDAAGSVRGDLDLSGTVGAPRVAGSLALEGASANLTQPNIRIEDGRIELRGDGSGDVAIEAHAASGEGSIDARGRLRLTAEGPQGELSAAGENFQIIDTLDLHVVVSPDLQLTLGAERLDIMGSVAVPRATIMSPGAREDTVAVSRDQVIVGTDDEQGAAARTIRPVHARVMLTLGDEVRIDAEGLSGQLAGGIDLTEAPGEPTTGSGELRIEGGTYEAYGQQLEIRTGRLLFAGGPIARPGLDIEAVREPAEDILVGARVRGTLERPELSVFSEPPMQQQEQLSYLVLGRPLADTSSAEESAVSRAAMALGLRGGNFVSERINANLGLDEFGIQTEPGDPASAASFVIGKYLSPSLYVSYGVGLFDPVSTIKLRYTVSSRWRLVTESSDEGSGGDIVYNIERSSD